MNNVKISLKLTFGFLFVALCAAVAGFIGYTTVASLGTSISELEGGTSAGLAGKVAALKSEQATAESVLLWTTLIACLLIVVFGFVLARSISEPLTRVLGTFEEVVLGRSARRLKFRREDEIGSLARLVDSLADDYQQLMTALQQVGDGDLSMDLRPRSERDEVTAALKKIIDSVRSLTNETQRLSRSATEGRIGQTNLGDSKGCYRDILQSVRTSLDALLTPLNDAAAVLTTLAEGDLTARVRSDYRGDLAKIKNALNAAMSHLDEGFSQVAVAAEQVASAANEISGGSHTLAQGASGQASSLEEISSSLREMAAMTKQATGNAKEAKGLTDAARTSADRGVESMRRLSAAIDRIKASSDETAKIVKTIDEIAFQTNLLALNAAVEAARAGDAGRGFAVVAEEVRNLAMRSAEAAKTTSNLIEESVKNAEGGVDINREVLSNLEEINQQVRKVSEVMAEMAAASDQQSEGIDQITTAVEQMNLLTQQTAANSEESASAAEELAGQAEEMKRVLSHYKLNLSPAPRRPILQAGSPVKAVAGQGLPQPKVARVLPPRRPIAAHSGGIQDPNKIIPLDETDTGILQEF
jgi:methyl-accepting chemotaxis protein